MAEDTEHLLPSSERQEKFFGEEQNSRKKSRTGNWTLFLLLSLFASCGLNILQAVKPMLQLGKSGYRGHISNGIQWTPDDLVEVRFPVQTDYGRVANLTHTDLLWDSLDADKGAVILDKGDPSLLRSEEFPWDTSKEIYLLNAYHGLHCLKSIYKFIRKTQDSPDENLSGEHLIHCLDMLRADVMCTADATPYLLNGNEVVRGDVSKLYQTRQCKKWEKLEAFAVENSACYQAGEPGGPEDSLEYWRNCPTGSPYQAVVDEYFS